MDQQGWFGTAGPEAQPEQQAPATKNDRDPRLKGLRVATRDPREGEVCDCGNPAVVTYMTSTAEGRTVETPYCGSVQVRQHESKIDTPEEVSGE